MNTTNTPQAFGQLPLEKGSIQGKLFREFL
jgi:hypothetical protein